MNRYPCASAETEYTAQELQNRDVVMAFYENGVNRGDSAAALSYLDPSYVEHNPEISAGRQGFAEFFNEFRKLHPRFRLEVKRVFIEGDMVAAHLRSHDGPTPNGEALVDIFRLENAKIVEHWGVTRPIPDGAANSNSMF
jgi:predicted SnoaL-like aldol condensation-catalyzing enzyme